MIEIINKEDSAKENWNQKEESIRLPKNIRQMGSPRGRHKIYLEDYVYIYLRTTSKDKESCAAVFLGKSQVVKDIRYTFIKGVIECSEVVFQWERISLDDSFWDYIYKEEKQYFPDTEIVGWFLGRAGQAMELSPMVEAAHRKYFAGRDKVLMLMDILEGEELFFVYEQGYLQKREGYYIYYEKNLSMQEYMVSKKEEEQKKRKGQAEAEHQDNQEQAQGMKFDSLAEQQNNAKENDVLLHKKDRKEINSKGKKDKGEKRSQVEEKSFEENEEQFLEELSYDLPKEEAKDKKDHLRDTEAESRALLKQMRSEEKKLERKRKEESIRQKSTANDKIFAKSKLEEPKTQAEEALEAYRRTILERQGKQTEHQKRNLLYTAASFFLVVLSVIGITTINNYRRMQKVEDVLKLINPEDKQQATAQKEDDGLLVETIDSQVEPLEEKQDKPLEEQSKETSADQSTVDEDKAQEMIDSQEDKAGDSQQKENSKKDKKTKKEAKSEEETPKEEVQEEPKQTEESQKDQNAEQGSKSDLPKDGEPQEQVQPPTADGTSSQARYYTVQPGDTLNSICLNIYHSKDMLETLREANGIEDGDKILAGQRLLLP